MGIDLDRSCCPSRPRLSRLPPSHPARLSRLPPSHPARLSRLRLSRLRLSRLRLNHPARPSRLRLSRLRLSRLAQSRQRSRTDPDTASAPRPRIGTRRSS